MGSITLTKAKGIWQTLPAPLRGAATLLAVLALAALLTTVRHNASAYLTGVWDTGSQTLVYGRIHQMEQGQHAPGGFLGVYTDDWSDDTNRALFRDDTPTDAAAFHPYTHQSGLQGWLFGRVNRLLRHWLPDGLARETALYWLNSTLFYAAELLVALAVWEEFGPLAAAFGFVSVLLAPWLQRGMKDLYWCLWTWLLPLLAALWLCHCTRVCGKTPRGCWPLVAAACMVRSTIVESVMPCARAAAATSATLHAGIDCIAGYCSFSATPWPYCSPLP